LSPEKPKTLERPKVGRPKTAKNLVASSIQAVQLGRKAAVARKPEKAVAKAVEQPVDINSAGLVLQTRCGRNIVKPTLFEAGKN
jgi:hypothetical protein